MLLCPFLNLNFLHSNNNIISCHLSIFFTNFTQELFATLIYCLNLLSMHNYFLHKKKGLFLFCNICSLKRIDILFKSFYYWVLFFTQQERPPFVCQYLYPQEILICFLNQLFSLEVQGIPTFHDFRICDPRYFVFQF